MNSTFDNLRVSAIASAVPKQKLDLHSLKDSFGAEQVNRIIKSTGIKSICVADDSIKTSDLCCAAAKNLFNNLNIDPTTIDAVVCITQTPDRVAPPTSVLLQAKLGISQDAVAFDISYGCSGYVYGLYQAALLLNSPGCSRVLVCAGDVITKLVHKEDINLRMLLGDAGSATLVEKGDDSWDICLHTDGMGAEHLTAASLFPDSNKKSNDPRHGYYFMDGGEVMKFALGPLVHNAIKKIYSSKSWAKDEFSLFMHQANSFMVNLLRIQTGLREDQVPIEVESVGNTGPATIPLLLSMVGDKYKNANKLTKSLLCGFGVGLSWGAVGMDLSQTEFFAPLEI